MNIVSGVLVLAYGVLALSAPLVLAPYGVTPVLVLVLCGLHLTFAGLAQKARRSTELASRAAADRALTTATAENERLKKEAEEAQTMHTLATRREAEIAARIAAAEKRADGLRAELEEARANEATPELWQAEIVSFVGLLQRKGRLIDFLMDDITSYSDVQVGAAARVVHQGCRAVFEEHFDIVPVRSDSEGTAITLDKDYSPVRYRLVGHVTGRPPFKGTLLHRGWMATKVQLPRIVASPDSPFPRDIIQPAEVELR